MALGPKQMQASIIRNLKGKTGKDLDQWIAIVKKQGIIDQKELMSFLKKEYTLGHFQAKIISEKAKGVDNYEDSSSFADQIFDTENTRMLYNFVKGKVMDLGADIREQPCKTYIPFYRKNQFVLITKQKDAILLGLNLPDDYKNEYLQAANNLGSARINRKIMIPSKTAWNDSVSSALKTAYLNN